MFAACEGHGYDRTCSALVRRADVSYACGTDAQIGHFEVRAGAGYAVRRHHDTCSKSPIGSSPASRRPHSNRRLNRTVHLSVLRPVLEESERHRTVL